jgi:hypothetical protein
MKWDRRDFLLPFQATPNEPEAKDYRVLQWGLDGLSIAVDGVWEICIYTLGMYGIVMIRRRCYWRGTGLDVIGVSFDGIALP